MKFCTTVTAAFLMLAVGLSTAYSDTVILTDNFESYADTDAMQAVWVGTDPGLSRIADNSNRPDAFPISGQGAEHLGGAVNLRSFSTLNPTASQYVRLSVDIFEDAGSANKRMSLGLRNSSGANILELGSWNANTCDPTVSGCSPGNTAAGGPGFIAADGRGLAHRVINFGTPISPLLVQPNWQYFNLPLEMDANENGNVSLFEVGAGWHTYTATIGPDFVTVEIDLFRDGLRNTSKVPDGNGDRPGTPGLDGAVTWTINTTTAGFNQIRFGGPSGVVSAGGSLIFDNILLSMIDPPPPGGVDGDFNDDGTVDAADYVVWRKNVGGGTALPNDGGLGTPIGSGHYNLWTTNFGSGTGGGGLSSAPVPEPATVALLMLGLVAIAIRRRNR